MRDFKCGFITSLRFDALPLMNSGYRYLEFCHQSHAPPILSGKTSSVKLGLSSSAREWVRRRELKIGKFAWSG